MEFKIQRATRSQTKLRLALTGASFAGKTTAALMLAKGLIEGMVEAGQLVGSPNPRIGMIDTERKRSHLYSHLVPFDVIDLAPPYAIDRYLGAMRALENANYEVIIIDSASHAWSGAGGLLSTIKSDNSFSEWRKATPLQDEFIDSIMRSPAHMIVTMRSKTEWVVEKQMSKSGREVNAPRRIGTKPIQRDGVEYEFTTLLDLQLTHDKKRRLIEVHKDNTGVFLDADLQAIENWTDAGKRCITWISEGAPVPRESKEPTPVEQAEAICAAGERLMARAPNLPDLDRIAAGTAARLDPLLPLLTDKQVDPLRRRFGTAKKARRTELAAPGTTAVAANPITPDDCDDIDGLIAMAGMAHADFCEHFGVARIGALDHARYEEAVTWIISAAGAEGVELARPVRKEQPLRATSALEKAKGIVDRIGSQKDDLLKQTGAST
jgi:hypothetical protein